ncbi:hypothetical protein EKL30_16990 [Candidimonas sp. SYP-B2681]|uniref:hypothetical protein n=1 Tax=Candidimonas sp. SYP-B2681 TaxID=2497686 RepID=UPI000F88C070|nr:hypothetical protein [Candidimonas sp. SYP-B2681]RTZ39954.1 hypothetical protein EKL30_16990 [Candidimonas sp. SYP-B2681]
MKKNRPADQTALIIAAIFQRSAEKRARISKKTLELVSARKVIKASFVARLQQEMEDLGILFPELETGGYGIMPAQSLRGAKSITVKNHAGDDWLRSSIRTGRPLTEDEAAELLDDVIGDTQDSEDGED